MILEAAGVKVTARALERAYDTSGKFLGRVWRDNRDVPVTEHVEAILAAVDRSLLGRLAPEVRAALVEAYGRPALLAPRVPTRERWRRCRPWPARATRSP